MVKNCVKNDGEIIKTENWGLLNLSYLIKKNKKGSYIHFKIKCDGQVISELEKNESIDKKLLRYLTIKVKKFDLKTNSKPVRNRYGNWMQKCIPNMVQKRSKSDPKIDRNRSNIDPKSMLR